MYTIPPKKMVTINILDILKKYSDMDHRLTQQDIADILKKEYYMDVDRKTIKRNLMNLLDLNCGIDYTEISRKDEKGNDTTICTDWYIQREFTDSELRLLIDSVLFSKNIPYTQCKQLIEKLKGLSNVYFDKKVKHICNLPDNQPRNKELFYTIDVLDEAISQNKKVAFMYNSYGPDKKLQPKREAEYIINPYQMVATNGRYYLICNYDKYDTLANYRVDRITNIKILDETRKPIKELTDGELNLPKHMAEHVYMFAGGSIRAKFKAKNYLIDQIVDWFGVDVNISPIDDEECMIEVKVNKEAFFCWAMQYSIHIEVMEPKDMRERIAAAVRQLNEKYNG
jgi:predicted DNA-binding transcriptional regulator YafY